MAYWAHDKNNVYTMFNIFKPKQNKHHNTMYSHIQIQGCKIIDDTIYFSEFNGHIEECYNMMNFVSSIVFDDEQTSNIGCKFNQLFYPRANITCIKFGKAYKQAFVLTRYLTHVTFVHYPQKPLALSPRIRYIWFNSSYWCLSFETSKNIVVFGMSFDFDCSFKPNKNMNYLSLGHFFKQDIISELSKNITHMIFNENFYFNKRIDLPKHLICLSIHCDYTHRVLLTPYIKYLFGVHVCHPNCIGERSNGRLCVLDTNAIFADNAPNGIKGIDVSRLSSNNMMSNKPNDLKMCSHYGHEYYMSLKYESNVEHFRYYC